MSGKVKMFRTKTLSYGQDMRVQTKNGPSSTLKPPRKSIKLHLDSESQSITRATVYIPTNHSILFLR